MLPSWERDKATAVVLYLAEAARLERCHIQVLCGLVFHADRLHLSRHGRLITGDDYAAVHNGMRPLQTYRLLVENDSDEFCFVDMPFNLNEPDGIIMHDMILIQPSDRMKLSRSDERCLDETLQWYRHAGSQQWRGCTRGTLWHEVSQSGALFRGEGKLREIPVSLGTIAASLPNAAEVIAYLRYLQGNCG